VTTAETNRGVAPAARADGLAAWAEASGHRRGKRDAGGGSRFAFYGRVSTEDWQDPVTSRARQREQDVPRRRTPTLTGTPPSGPAASTGRRRTRRGPAAAQWS
jgi:hypothetical protein